MNAEERYELEATAEALAPKLREAIPSKADFVLVIFEEGSDFSTLSASTERSKTIKALKEMLRKLERIA